METQQKKWTEGLLIDHFKLQRLYEDMPLLNVWLDAPSNLSEADRLRLEELRVALFRNVDYWNEETLKMKFIAFVVDMVKYDFGNVHTFFEADLKAELSGQHLKTKADFIVATAVADLIKAPYFCFHEYKRERKYADDPIAQVLVAMLIAQVLNNNDKPIYGCYVIGRSWFFMVIQGKQYAVSNAYNATKTKDLHRIVSILKYFKVILETDLLL